MVVLYCCVQGRISVTAADGEGVGFQTTLKGALSPRAVSNTKLCAITFIGEKITSYLQGGIATNNDDKRKFFVS